MQRENKGNSVHNRKKDCYQLSSFVLSRGDDYDLLHPDGLTEGPVGLQPQRSQLVLSEVHAAVWHVYTSVYTTLLVSVDPHIRLVFLVGKTTHRKANGNAAMSSRLIVPCIKHELIHAQK